MKQETGKSGVMEYRSDGTALIKTNFFIPALQHSSTPLLQHNTPSLHELRLKQLTIVIVL
jgi:hypothetical protein